MQPQGSECRVYERHSCQVPTSCQPAASNEMRWEATIEDISKAGFRIRLGRRFEPRSGLAIELPGKVGQEPYTVYVKVVHVHNEGDGTWTLGCRLMSELSDEELQRLAGRAPAKPTEAIATVIPHVRLRIGIDNGRSVYCRVKRFHVTGAWPMPPGKAFSVRGVAANGSQLDHQFEVVQCSPQGEGWTIHVKPVDPAAAPSWLQAFGRQENN